MSYLVRAIKRIIDNIDAHMALKLQIELGQIPEAHLASKIALKKLSADLLEYKQVEDGKDEAPMGAEVDKLALYLSELKLDLSKQKYLEQILSFDEITWRELMDLDYKGFGSKILNNFGGQPIDYKKLVIVAHMKHQLIQKMRLAVDELEHRDKFMRLAQEDEAEVKRGAKGKKGKGRREGGALAADGMEEKDEAGPLSEVACIDTWLHEETARVIAQAEALTHEVRSGRDRRERSVIEFNYGEGKTGPLLSSCKSVAAKLYLFMEMVDEGKIGLGKGEVPIEKHITPPGSEYALRDCMNSRRKTQNPTVMAMMDAMEYVLDNIDRNSHVSATADRTFMSYISSPVEYMKDSIVSLSHDSTTTLAKRGEIFQFFRDLKFKILEDQAQTHAEVLRSIDVHGLVAQSMGSGLYFSQRLTQSYAAMHRRVLDCADDSVRDNHHCIFLR
jgi:hypothetical protein